MTNKRFFAGFSLAALALLAVVGCSDNDKIDTIANSGNQSQPQMAKVRVIHTSYNAPAVDVSLNGTVAISNLSYGGSSGYAEVNAGSYQTKVMPTGQMSPVVIDANLTLLADKDYTVYAVNSLNSIEAVVSIDDRNIVNNKAKVRFLHASPDAPAVDIKLNSGNGPVVYSNVSFKDVTAYAEINGGSYTFVVTPAGSTAEVFVFDPVAVANGGIYTVVAHGTLDNSDNYGFDVRVFIDNNTGDGFADLTVATAKVLIVHASPDAPGVDLLVDGLVVNSSALEFPDNTGYLGVPAGDRNVMVNASGTDLTVIDATLNLDANNNYSVFAVDVLDNISPLVLMDDLSTPTSGNAHVRFLHLSPDAPAVDITLKDGTIIFGNIGFKEYTQFTPIPAGTYDLQVRVAGTSTVALELTGVTVGDGSIYTVFAKGFLNGSAKEALGAEFIMNN